MLQLIQKFPLTPLDSTGCALGAKMGMRPFEKVERSFVQVVLGRGFYVEFMSYKLTCD